jgi:putative transcriptional regulator
MDINPLDYTITELNKLIPKKGRLLIAEPFMDDLYFKRSVVLLTEHSKNGTFGFILNKPLEIDVNDVLVDFPTFKAPVFMGGPVQSDSLFFIHTQGDLIDDSLPIKDNLYWSGNFTQLKQLITDQQIFPNEIKFFIGYSGWDSGQLNSEIKNDESWIISAPEITNINELNNSELWRESLQKMGSKYSLLSNFPEDPSLN